MKVVILAGGMGTRISEYTKTVPKPMIKVCGKPIIHRIIDHYIKYGHKEFIIALGFKGNLIKKYFSQIKLDKSIKIQLVNTGLKTMTGGRLKRLKKFLNETFLMTYGDGLSSVNLSKLLNFDEPELVFFDWVWPYQEVDNEYLDEFEYCRRRSTKCQMSCPSFIVGTLEHGGHNVLHLNVQDTFNLKEPIGLVWRLEELVPLD